MRMRYISTLVLLIFTVSLFSQSDFSGMPVKTLSGSSQHTNTKSAWAISPSVIVNAIPSPVQYIADITWSNNYILAEGYNEYQIYVLDPADGSVVKTIPTDIQRPYGLTYDGQFLWILDNANKLIEKVNMSDGTVVDTIFINNTTNTYPTGMTWMNGQLWYNDAIGPSMAITGDMTRNIDIFGNTIQCFSSVGDYPSGLTFDGTYLWTADNSEKLIHQIDPVTFDVIKTIEAPGGNYPNGLAWDGNYLWVSNNDADTIYQLDVRENVTYADNNSYNPVDVDFVNIYPNPVSNILNINCSGEFKFEMYNSNGKLVLKSNKKENDVSDINQGLYIINIKDSNNIIVKTEKIIIL